jgi:hypothetical protein
MVIDPPPDTLKPVIDPPPDALKPVIDPAAGRPETGLPVRADSTGGCNGFLMWRSLWWWC